MNEKDMNTDNNLNSDSYTDLGSVSDNKTKIKTDINIEANTKAKTKPDSENIYGESGFIDESGFVAEERFAPEANWISNEDEFNLTEFDQTLRQLIIGVGWDVRNFEGESIDMDSSCFLLNRADKTRENSDFIFYNNESGSEGAVRHTGDSRTGAGDGDDETIIVELSALPYDIEKIVFTVSIYQGSLKGQDFSQVRNLFIRFANLETNEEMCRFDIGANVKDSKATAVIATTISREGPNWIIRPGIEYFRKGLGEIATAYDIIVSE